MGSRNVTEAIPQAHALAQFARAKQKINVIVIVVTIMEYS